MGVTSGFIVPQQTLRLAAQDRLFSAPQDFTCLEQGDRPSGKFIFSDGAGAHQQLDPAILAALDDLGGNQTLANAQSFVCNGGLNRAGFAGGSNS